MIWPRQDQGRSNRILSVVLVLTTALVALAIGVADANEPTNTQSISLYEDPAVSLSEPNVVAVDPSGNIWVAEGGRDRLLEFNSERKYVRQLGTEGSGPSQFKGIGGIAVASEGPDKGDIYVVDSGNDRVKEFGPSGEHLRAPNKKRVWDAVVVDGVYGETFGQ